MPNAMPPRFVRHVLTGHPPGVPRRKPDCECRVIPDHKIRLPSDS